jgi:hypothetical protein
MRPGIPERFESLKIPELLGISEKPSKIVARAGSFSVRPSRKDRIGWFYENIPFDYICCG